MKRSTLGKIIGTLGIATVFGICGAKRANSLENSEKNAGSYNAKWDGKDEQGNSFGNGFYLYQLNAGKYKETRKMTLVK